MAKKVWVLDTETKGTGARMIPLEKAQPRPGGERREIFVPPEPRPRAPEAPAPRRPRRFKVVDVMTEQVLAEDADARATVDALADVRSVVDIRIYVWEHETERWRMLGHRERKVLWDVRSRANAD
jgi:hypothetical protein